MSRVVDWDGKNVHETPALAVRLMEQLVSVFVVGVLADQERVEAAAVDEDALSPVSLVRVGVSEMAILVRRDVGEIAVAGSRSGKSTGVRRLAPGGDIRSFCTQVLEAFQKLRPLFGRESLGLLEDVVDGAHSQ